MGSGIITKKRKPRPPLGQPVAIGWPPKGRLLKPHEITLPKVSIQCRKT